MLYQETYCTFIFSPFVLSLLQPHSEPSWPELHVRAHWHWQQTEIRVLPLIFRSEELLLYLKVRESGFGYWLVLWNSVGLCVVPLSLNFPAVLPIFLSVSHKSLHLGRRTSPCCSCTLSSADNRIYLFASHPLGGKGIIASVEYVEAGESAWLQFLLLLSGAVRN